MSTIRGVVVCPRYQLDSQGFTLDALLSPADLRRYLLYWDRIAYAFPNGFGKPNLDASLDLQYLEREGLLTLHDTSLTTTDLGKPELQTPPHLAAATGGALVSNAAPTAENPTGLLILGHPITLWHELNYLAPVRAAALLQADGASIWSTAYTGTMPSIASRLGPPALVAEAALVSSLPIPQDEVALEDILQFKLKRRDELLRLRLAIDQLRDKATRCEDLARGLAHSRDELSIALTDLAHALRSGGMRTFFSTLKLYLDVSDNKFLASAAAGAAAAHGMELPLELGALLGMGLNTALTFAARVQQRPSVLPPALSDFVYLYDLARFWPTRA